MAPGRRVMVVVGMAVTIRTMNVFMPIASIVMAFFAAEGRATEAMVMTMETFAVGG